MINRLTNARKLTALILALALPLFGATMARADNATAQSGPGYFLISPPQKPTSGDKIEVVEVFSYGCVHCAHFQPEVDKWSKRVDKTAVQFTYLPATFNALFHLMARGYYAASSLGAVASTHQQVFDALFVSNKQIRTIEDLADLYASFGVKRDAFMKAAQSFFVESQLQRANELTQAYGIDGTPSIVVAGKYRITAQSAGGPDKIFAVVDRLVAKERAARSGK